MRSFRSALVVVLMAFVDAVQVQGQPQFPEQTTPLEARELAEGHELALALCSVCHIATPDQLGTPVMSAPGPPFRDIANRPAVDAAALRHFMLTTHSTTAPPFTMPNPKLTDRQLDAVIAYILSLRGR